jgi:flagellar biosynthesis/type III secretory pathway protein FliH
LRAQLASLGEKLAEVEAAGAEATHSAHEEGRRQGLREAENREAERVAMLREGFEVAIEDWRARLKGWDGLAAALAGAALGRVFEPHADLGERVTRMLARQLREVRRVSVVTIHVSRSDFSDGDALDALGRRLSGDDASFSIEVDPELEAGTCRIACRLEQIDLDARADWLKLVRLLDEMAIEAEAT